MHRLPTLPEHLVSLTSHFAGPSASLSDIRNVTFCLIGFAGFLRFDENSNIKWCHITIHETHLSIFLPRSKTDQFHNGSTVIIAQTGNATVSYNMLLRYASLACADITSSNFRFLVILFSIVVETLILSVRVHSYPILEVRRSYCGSSKK